MKKFAVLLTTAILGSAAFAAGTNMIQDEPGPDSRPARNVEKRSNDPLAPARADDAFGPGNAPGQTIRIGNDHEDGNPLNNTIDNAPGQTIRIGNDLYPAADDYGNTVDATEGPGMGTMGGGFGYGGASGGPGMGGPGMGMGGPGMGMGGPGMGSGGGMSGPEGRYMRPRSVTRTIVEQRMEPLSKEEIVEMKKLAEATRLLHKSKNDESRKKAADTIREQLNAQFDRDLKRREKELSDIEARLKTLREQVEKRKAARDRIVGLRLDTIVNEADGLGFPADSVGSANNFPSRNRSAAGGEWLDVPAGQTLPGGNRVPGLGTTMPTLDTTMPIQERRDFLLTPADAAAIDNPEPAEVPEEVSNELPADLQPR